MKKKTAAKEGGFFRLPGEFLEILAQAAKAAGVSQAQLVEMCVMKNMDPAIRDLESAEAVRRERAKSNLAELLAASVNRRINSGKDDARSQDKVRKAALETATDLIEKKKEKRELRGQ